MRQIKIIFTILLGLILMTGCGDRFHGFSPDKKTEVILEKEGLIIMDSIDPCGDGPGPDEILLVLSDGSIVAWYKDLGLSYLEPGTYQTTDAQACVFTVTTNGEVIDD